MMHLEDDALVRYCLEGDTDAFGVLVHKYQEMVYAYAFQKVKNDADARDIVQEVFLRAYRHLDKLKFPHRFRTWLYTIMSNECKRWLARTVKDRETGLDDMADTVSQVEPEHARSPDDWQVDLEQAIAELSEDNRVLVSMFYMGDCSLREIGEFLGVSANTVKVRLHRARQKLGETLSERYGYHLRNHKLKGGFLMQTMNRIHQLPRPIISPTWRGQMIRQIPFAVTATLCVLLGVMGLLLSPEEEIWPFQGHPSTDLHMANRKTEPVELVLLAYPDKPVMPLMATREPKGVVSSEAGAQTTESAGGLTVANALTSPQPANASSVAFSDTQWMMTVSGSVQKAAEVGADNPVMRVDPKGSVTVMDGQWSIMEPVPDAHVYVYNWTNGIIQEGRTRTDGSFQLKIPKLEGREWDSSTLTVTARHPRYSYGWTKLSKDNISNVVVRLYVPSPITGKVVNEEGQGVAGAMVRVIRVSPVSYPSAPPPLPEVPLLGEYFPGATVRTDSKGDFEVPFLPTLSKATFQVTAPGYAREPGVPKTSFTHEAGTVNVRFELKREARIQGRVLFSETGAPATGVKIRAKGVFPTLGWDEARTDENGNYLLTNLLPGKYNVSLVSQHKYITPLKEEPPYWVSLPIDHVTVDSGETVKGVDLELIKGGLITGRVTDMDTNEPIADQTIFLKPVSQDIYYRTDTDETGFYRFRSAPGEVSVYLWVPEGYDDVGMGKRTYPKATKHVDVMEGLEISDVHFQFRKHVAFTGIVLSPEGKPVGGVQIKDRITGWIYAQSDRDGKFTITGSRMGNEFWAKAEHRILQLRGYSEPNLQPGSVVTIAMEKYQITSASGRVVDEEGKPIPSARISLRTLDPEAQDGGQTSSWKLKTDSSGHYTTSARRSVRLIIGDEYAIIAEAEGYAKGSTKNFVAKADMRPLEDIVLATAK